MLLRSLILTGAINGLFFILLLKNKPQNSISDRILMIWMAVISLQLAFYYDNLSARPVFPGYLQLISLSLPLVNSPILYFYIRSLSFEADLKWKSMPVHLAPFLIFNCITFFLYYVKRDNLFLKDGFPHFSSNLNSGLGYFVTALLAIIPGYYTILSFFVLLRHQKKTTG